MSIANMLPQVEPTRHARRRGSVFFDQEPNRSALLDKVLRNLKGQGHKKTRPRRPGNEICHGNSFL
jgi:hypothetical protein